MNNDHDPYLILGVAESATSNDIKAAFHRAAHRFHPDKNDHPSAALQFQDISAAYELLMDIQAREKYDREHAQKSADAMRFSLRVIPSKRTVAHLDEPQVVYLLVDVQPDPRAKKQDKRQESPLNLTLVLDHSNSMSGSRLEKVKVAAHQIIEHLNPTDILSVVSFNDRAQVVIPATQVTDKPALKARVTMMMASGGTEIFQGLAAGVTQVRQFLAPKMVNHIVLLTDGKTYNDEERCIKLAETVKKQGIVISAMGLGQEWNDEFLDKLASSTGGTCQYIHSANRVVRFLNDHVRNLSDAFADRMQLSIAPDPDVVLESAFKLAPSPQPLSIEAGLIPLGSLQANRQITVLLQLELKPDLAISFRTVARVVATGDVLADGVHPHQAIGDLEIEVRDEPQQEKPPTAILDALGKLTLYQMQERAQQALERGDAREATHRLERLATRLLDMGEEELAAQARSEARRVAMTSQFSDTGKKTLKFQTRYLMAETAIEN
jgi:Ca-activated chloride channel family protein